MIQPDFKTFSRLARRGNLVPVYDSLTADLLTPVGAFQRIARGARHAPTRATRRPPGPESAR